MGYVRLQRPGSQSVLWFIVADNAVRVDTVLEWFEADGEPKDSRFSLPTGNREMSGLRQLRWPQSLFYYEPGVR